MNEFWRARHVAHRVSKNAQISKLIHDLLSVLRDDTRMNDRKLLTKVELAPRYKVVPRTVDSWMKRGIIPYLKIGPKIVRFDADECDKALEKFKVKAKDG
jgi:hypothetical protein